MPDRQSLELDGSNAPTITVTQDVLTSLVNIAICLACVVLLFAALHDIGTRTIPNWASVAVAALGIVIRACQHDLPAGLAAGILVFLAAALAWRRAWMGGGDVKLLGACALLVAPLDVGGFVTLVALSGGCLALLYLVMGRLVPSPGRPLPPTLIRRMLRVEQWRISHRHALPYGVAIVAGSLTTLLQRMTGR